jgi:DNA-binding NarL/FixJ family response regulator
MGRETTAMSPRRRSASKSDAQARPAIIVLEDSGLQRDTLADSLEKNGFWALRATTLDDAVAKAANKPVAALCDISLNGINTDEFGLVAAKRIREVSPETLCMVITFSPEESLPRLVRKAMLAPDESRFDGFVTKNEGLDRVLEAIEALLRDGYYVEPRLAKKLYVDGDKVLTDREIAVTRLLRDGVEQRDMPQRLFIGAESVKRAVASARAKLGAATPAALVHEAELRGYLRETIDA